jgi:hypothetical protein
MGSSGEINYIIIVKYSAFLLHSFRDLFLANRNRTGVLYVWSIIIYLSKELKEVPA